MLFTNKYSKSLKNTNHKIIRYVKNNVTIATNINAALYFQNDNNCYIIVSKKTFRNSDQYILRRLFTLYLLTFKRKTTDLQPLKKLCPINGQSYD